MTTLNAEAFVSVYWIALFGGWRISLSTLISLPIYMLVYMASPTSRVVRVPQDAPAPVTHSISRAISYCCQCFTGRRVLELFRARGWSTIVSDNLVGFVLATITVSVAVMTGLIAVAIELGVSSHFHDENTEVGSYLGMNKVATFS